MGGLSFLSKKSWHPSTLRNEEKVWKAEQAAAEEKKRIEELQRQVGEERQMMELRQLHESSGHAQAGPARVDWMYQGPMSTADEQRTADAYLLGKEYRPADSGVSEIKALESAPGSMLAAPTRPVNSANEAFRRLNEDPLFAMKRAERDAKAAVVSNPVKMSRIQAELEREMREKRAKKEARREAKKARKHERKEAKRARKEKEKNKRRHGDSSASGSSGSSDSGESSDGVRDSKKRKQGSERPARPEAAAPASPTAHKRRRREDSRDREDARGQDGARGGGGGGSSSNRGGRRSASRSPQGHRDDRRRKEGRSDNRDGNSNSGERGKANGRGDGEAAGDSGPRRYGLITGGSGGGEKRREALGPEPKLLEQRRREEDESEAKKAAARRRARPMSHEEKLRKLAEMEQDASTHQQLLRQRIEEGKKLRAEEGDGDAKPTGKAVFLKDASAAAYDGQQLSDRVQRGRHFRQKGMDAEKFMER